MTPFWIALQFLTRLPIHLKNVPTPEQNGRSLLYYPLVGAVLGFILCVAAYLLADAPEYLGAALLLTVWVILTGGLHMDGLADSADAWVGGYGDRERTLSIMKDPRSGPMGILAIVLVLLIKWSALVAILPSGDAWGVLLATTIAARAMMVVMLTRLPYVRAQGLGSDLAAYVPAKTALWVVLISAVLVLWLLGITAVFALVIFYGFVGYALHKRLGGTTGDTAGAVLELCETLLLVVVALNL